VRYICTWRSSKEGTKLFDQAFNIWKKTKKLILPTLYCCKARCDMIEVFKILHGYYDNINNISLLPHIDVATRVVTNINCIKVLLHKILESTFSITE